MLTIRNAALAVLGSALLQTMFGAMLTETLMGGDARRSLQTTEVACTKPMCTDGAKTYAEAGAICSAAGAQLCTGRSVPVAFRGQCRDEGNDCCANDNQGEPASCPPGFSPTAQPTSWDDCPNYECVPDFSWLGALMIAVHVVPCAIIFSLITCCSFYYRNKSNNTAPWNGQPVQSFAQAATAQVAQMQTVQLQCPEGMVRNPKEKENAPEKRTFASQACVM
eukprot:COSAG04_NODE_433_length_14482_cov_11.959466_6_plen_222_part_00